MLQTEIPNEITEWIALGRLENKRGIFIQRQKKKESEPK